MLAEASAGADAGNSKFAKALGSTDYMTREKGLQALQRWLCLKGDLTEMDMLKIWKGLFFCFWHSDKAPMQVRRQLLLHHYLQWQGCPVGKVPAVRLSGGVAAVHNRLCVLEAVVLLADAWLDG